MTGIKPIIIAGKKNSGKTTYLKFLSHKIQKKGLKLAGYISQAEIQNGKKIAYYLINLQTQEELLLATTKDIYSSKISIGDYYFNEDVFKIARNTLLNSIYADALIMDEIGLLELNGLGFFESFKYILKNYQGIFIFSVRTQLLTHVIELVKKYKT